MPQRVWALLGVFVIQRISDSGEGKHVKKLLFGALCFLVVVSFLLLSFEVWRFHTKTVLFSDDTVNGYHVQVIEKGHQFLTGSHRILIAIDDEEICEFALFLPYSAQTTASLFPSKSISCEVDSNTSYKIAFDTGHQSFIEFDADFTQIKCDRIWEYEHIHDGIELVALWELKS